MKAIILLAGILIVVSRMGTGMAVPPKPEGSASVTYQAGTRLYCIVRGLALREGASPTARRIGLVRRGETVLVLARGAATSVHFHGKTYHRSWYRIRTATGLSGWSHGAFLQPRLYAMPTVMNNNVSAAHSLYPLGWSRQGKLALVMVGRVSPATYGSTHRLVILDPRDGRQLVQVRTWDVWRDTYARRKGIRLRTGREFAGMSPMAMFWDMETVDLHEALATNGIVPGIGLEIRPFRDRIRIGKVEYADRFSATLPVDTGRGTTGGSLHLFRTVAGVRKTVYREFYDGSRSYQGERFCAWMRNPFTGALFFLVVNPRDDFQEIRFVPEALLQADPQPRRIVVNSAAALLAAIAPHRELHLAPGRYDLGGVAGFTNAFVRREPGGWYICGVTGLSLSGSGKTEIVTDRPDACVLGWRNCLEVTMRGISLGHINASPGSCSAGVLELSGCLGVRMEGLLLWGLSLAGCEDLLVSRTSFIHCTRNALRVDGGRHITLRDCRVAHNTTREDLFSLNQPAFLSFERCQIFDNRSPGWLSFTPRRGGFEPWTRGGEVVLFRNCSINGNAFATAVVPGQRGVQLIDCRIGKNAHSTKR